MCDIDPSMKHGVLRMPPGATTRLLNSLKPPPPVEEDRGTPRRAEEDGMDVDPQTQPQAGTSTDTREQKHGVPGVQLYDGSKSSVRDPPPQAPPHFPEKTRSSCVVGVQQTQIFLPPG